jgi:thioredoxin 1
MIKMSDIINITKDNWNDKIANSELPVLLKFWAPWCGPCKYLGITLKDIAVEHDGKLIIAEVNIDDTSASTLIDKYEISSVPTCLIIINGKVEKKIIGNRPKAAINEILKDFLPK